MGFTYLLTRRHRRIVTTLFPPRLRRLGAIFSLAAMFRHVPSSRKKKKRDKGLIPLFHQNEFACKIRQLTLYSVIHSRIL